MSDDLSEIAKQGLEPIGDIVKRVAGPLADEIGESLAVLARPYRIMLSVKMFQKTQRMLKEAGITPQAVPPRLFLPILEGASIQDDDDLHTRWSALLANAATSPELVHPSYVEILKQLTLRTPNFWTSSMIPAKRNGTGVSRRGSIRSHTQNAKDE